MILLMTSDSVSANGTVKEFSEEKKNFLAGLQLDRLVDSSFFSNFLKQNLSDACRQNLISFSTSLKKFELWAVESEFLFVTSRISGKYPNLIIYSVGRKRETAERDLER